MTRLLDGIRVIDAANFIAGPVSTTIMADFGADVIKVEPPTGDVYRVRGAGYVPSPYNYPWIVDNRSKRSVAIDLRMADGQALLHRLVRDVDVFVTNTPLDSRARLRVRYEDLAPLNERLIYASISAYGESGEEASKPGFDSIALWARTGLMDLVRASPDVPPARSLPGMGDHPTGMSLFAAIMAGLYHRERTGRGTAVSTSLLANGLWMNAIPVQGILCGARTEVRPPREDRASRPPTPAAQTPAPSPPSSMRGSRPRSGRPGHPSSRRPESPSAWSPLSTTCATTPRCSRAARWSPSTIRGRALRTPCRARSTSRATRRWPPPSPRKSASTPSRSFAAPASPRQRSSASFASG